MSNLFELLVYSEKLGRFEQWFDCFTILFGISASIWIEEYGNLKEMVQVEIEEDRFEMVNGYTNSMDSPMDIDQFDIDGINWGPDSAILSSISTWVKELIPTNLRNNC